MTQKTQSLYRVSYLSLIGLLSVYAQNTFADAKQVSTGLMKAVEVLSGEAYSDSPRSSISYDINNAQCRLDKLAQHDRNYAVAYQATCSKGQEQASSTVIAYRGSANTNELLDQFLSALFSLGTGGNKVDSMRFYSLPYFTDRFNAVADFTKKWFENDKVSHKVLTGHSLGGAISHIAFSSTKTDYPIRGMKHTVSFNSPRVFARQDERNAYRDQQDTRKGKFLIERYFDPVQSIPPQYHGFNFSSRKRYSASAKFSLNLFDNHDRKYSNGDLKNAVNAFWPHYNPSAQ